MRKEKSLKKNNQLNFMEVKQMEKNIGYLIAVLAVVLIISSFSLGRVTAPIRIETEIQEVETIIEVPTIVNKTITEIVEVLDTEVLLDNAISDFLEEVEDDEDLQICDLIEYDEDQIEIKKIYDYYSLEIDDDETEVIFSLKLKYLDDDVEEKCYNTFDVSVLYDPDEDPVVEII